MIEFHADGVKVAGPKIDGSWSVTFNVGEYEQVEVAKLLMLQQHQVLTVRVDDDSN